MLYCLSGRQPRELLRKADQIKVEMRDYRALPMYLEDYPDKEIILDFEELPENFQWEFLEEINNGNLVCALNRLDFISFCKKHNLKFYYKYPVTSFYEIYNLKMSGCCYVVIGSVLVHYLDKVAIYKVPVRFYPNLAYEPYMANKDGIIGGWVRPEDIEAYGKYISVSEFYAPKSLEKEASLFHIYAENKQWPGNLNLLIDNLKVDCDNRIIYDAEHFAERRMNCEHKCLIGKHCDYCYKQVLGSEKLIQSYIVYKEEKNES